MKHCDKCGTDIRGNCELCPLCQGHLTGTGEEPLFPTLPLIYKKFKLFFQILLLSLTGVSVAAVAVNIMLPETGAWSVFAVTGAVCFWISLWLAIKRRSNIPKNITTQVVFVSVCAVLFDILTGWHAWSLEYVFPVICTGAMIALGILARVLKLPDEDFLACIVSDIFFGIIPLIFCLTGIITMIIPSVVCIGGSILSFAALMIFRGRSIRVELEKRFHM